jgi:hypothetical protein
MIKIFLPINNHQKTRRTRPEKGCFRDFWAFSTEAVWDAYRSDSPERRPVPGLDIASKQSTVDSNEAREGFPKAVDFVRRSVQMSSDENLDCGPPPRA